jgi:hypothetical protein
MHILRTVCAGRAVGDEGCLCHGDVPVPSVERFVNGDSLSGLLESRMTFSLEFAKEVQ